jgi:GntR family transcriptional regulator
MTEAIFYKKYRPKHLEGLRKHEILRATIMAAIQDGHWETGIQLPTELELSKITPFSLGTVQKAVGSLTREGLLHRKRGLGTFVIPIERRIGGPWIFRFITPDGLGFYPMSTKVIKKKIITSKEQWSPWLTEGKPSKKILQIDRLIYVDQYVFYSQYFLDPAKFPIIMNTPTKNLDSANFIGLIQDAYKVQLKNVDRTIECTTFPAEINSALNLPKKNKGVLGEIKATGNHDSPIFFQQLFLPADGPKLFFAQNGFY